MKVFEVITEFATDNKKIEKEVQYVTAKDDSLGTVAAYFERHCEEYDKELVSVRYVLTITQKIE